MSDAVAKLLEQIMDLPAEDRRLIAEHVQASLDAGEAEDALMADPEWRAEFERRLEQVEKHPEQLLDGEQVLAELRERYRRKSDA